MQMHTNPMTPHCAAISDVLIVELAFVELRAGELIPMGLGEDCPEYYI